MQIEKALKVIPEAIVNDEEAMVDLQNESRTMIALNHPNIVRVYDFHDEGRIKYIDMEYVEGKTLTKLKLEHPHKQIPEEEVKKYALKIAEGLAYAHSRNVIHKDIKPQNVMITKQGEVKLMDFGIAETVRTSMSRIQNTSSSGTLVYMSPEQLLGKDVGKESDIYSFGAMLYELLSGHPPFYKGDINYQILNKEPEKLDNVPEKMNELVLKCLEKEYKDRYSSFKTIIKQMGGQFQTIEPMEEIKTFEQSTNIIKKLVSVSIKTNPVDTQITIDGKEKGNSSFKEKLTIGKHSIIVAKEGYKQIKSTLEISVNTSNDFYIELESLVGEITVTSDPPKQPIMMNGEKTDFVTPHTFKNIIPGKPYTFQVETEEFLSEKQAIRIKNKEKKEITLKSILGEIVVKSDPPGQPIIFDKKNSGFVTPHTFKNIVPGKTYKFQIDTPEFLSKPQEVTIKENEKKEVFLKSILGKIKVTSEPTSSSIYVNAENTNHKTPYIIENVVPGKGYSIKLKNEECYSISEEVIINENQDNKLFLELTKYPIIEGMLLVHAGSFLMGKHGKGLDEQPTHNVRIYDFFIGKYPVTQKEWNEVMNNNPSFFKRKTGFLGLGDILANENNPVERITWFEAAEFCNKKSIKEALTSCYSGSGKNIRCDFSANGYRLPTEAEWEYAAKGGNKSQGYKYSGSDTIDKVAWFSGNSEKKAHPVGEKQPNEIGLYDMSGNLWEWCWDYYECDYYSNSPLDNPKGLSKGSFRVLRGGSWLHNKSQCCVAYRNNSLPDSSGHSYGFRVVKNTDI